MGTEDFLYCCIKFPMNHFGVFSWWWPLNACKLFWVLVKYNVWIMNTIIGSNCLGLNPDSPVT